MKNAEEQKKVLIIDDSMLVIKSWMNLLQNDYKVYFATNGQEGIDLAKEILPDIILLDIVMEPVDGYEVCHVLKSDSNTTDIPIIFVTAVSEAMDEAMGFDIGGADYITKPFVPVVALARIKHHIQLSVYVKELRRLYSLALDANPITHLPGNNTIAKHIGELIKDQPSHFVFYADIDNFKSYNDTYGFANGDHIILDTAELMKSTADDMNLSEAFFGHIGGDDFVITIDKQHAIAYVTDLLDRYDAMAKTHYHEDDLQRGYIVSTNRTGQKVTFPLVSLSIAGVDLSFKKYENYLQINDICAELKCKAKKIEGSCYLIDKRR